ncbi:MAG: divalent-cation tolerance protein CutA [bacterium]
MKLILSTCPENEVEKIANNLLEEKLIACVNVINGISSRYWWKGKIEKETEALLLMKTKDSLIENLISRIKELHSYEVPEVVVLDIEKGNPDYLKWIEEVTK